jgi:hypothetical protein
MPLIIIFKKRSYNRNSEVPRTKLKHRKEMKTQTKLQNKIIFSFLRLEKEKLERQNSRN